ncbi:MAG: hypothetical protein HC897_08200 [Thermoanaerobaculia bacterium]|nr:hypothetical protein [Thermoanaerobaculia bacterium]
MEHLRRSLEALRASKPEFRQAVENVFEDVASPENPHGNLGAGLVAALDHHASAFTDAQRTIEEHGCIEKPSLHRRVSPPGQVLRVMAPRHFVVYHVLESSGSADESEVGAWLLALTPGHHYLAKDDLAGRTGAPGRPCWWTFEEADHPAPSTGETYVHELGLGEIQCRQAEQDGAVVEVTLLSERVGGGFFKPTALEGFGSMTRFRPELSGSAWGRTVPDRPELRGRPELVSSGAAYREVLADADEIAVRVLSF